MIDLYGSKALVGVPTLTPIPFDSSVYGHIALTPGVIGSVGYLMEKFASDPSDVAAIQREIDNVNHFELAQHIQLSDENKRIDVTTHAGPVLGFYFENWADRDKIEFDKFLSMLEGSNNYIDLLGKETPESKINALIEQTSLEIKTAEPSLVNWSKMIGDVQQKIIDAIAVKAEYLGKQD